MSDGTPTASLAAGTGGRIPDQSGMCTVCPDGCHGSCEIARSSCRGREIIYPKSFGMATAGAAKRYPVDYSHLNIQGMCAGTAGVNDKVIFPAVSTETLLGNKHKLKLSLPVFTEALGSTDVAMDNWEGLAVGSAISGIIVVIGEHVAGMDPGAEYKGRKVVCSPELERRIKLFKQWHNGAGEIILQQNVEDTKFGSAEYAIEKLKVQCIELTWGQGGRSTGCAARPVTKTSDRIIPGPPSREDFLKAVEYYRNAGAKFISLRTGAYRITDLARAIRCASEAEIDLLTIDGAYNSTAMNPWRMMNEWGIPTIYLQSIAYKFASQLKAKGMHMPDLAIAGGFSLEDHIFKALALGAPHFRAVGLGRTLMIPALIGKNIEKWIAEDSVPSDIKRYGDVPERIFITFETLKARFGKEFKKLPLAAVAMYTFCDRLQAGLQQLTAGTRKSSLTYLDRSDLVSLTKEATEVTGIPYVMEADMEEAQKILLC